MKHESNLNNHVRELLSKIFNAGTTLLTGNYKLDKSVTEITDKCEQDHCREMDFAIYYSESIPVQQIYGRG